MSKLFMYDTPLEGVEQLAVECTQSLLHMVELLDIPDMGPTTIYSINRVRASMLMVPNFQARRSGIVINLILIVEEVQKIATAMLLMLVKAWTTVDTLVRILKPMWIRKGIKT